MDDGGGKPICRPANPRGDGELETGACKILRMSQQSP